MGIVNSGLYDHITPKTLQRRNGRISQKNILSNEAGRGFHLEVRDLRMKRVKCESARYLTHVKAGALPERRMNEIRRHAVVTEEQVGGVQCQTIQPEVIPIQAPGPGGTLNIVLRTVAAETEVIEADTPGFRGGLILRSLQASLRFDDDNMRVFRQELFEHDVMRPQVDLLCNHRRPSDVNAELFSRCRVVIVELNVCQRHHPEPDIGIC